MRNHTSFFTNATLLLLVLSSCLFAQERAFGIEAENKRWGYVRNTTPYKLLVTDLRSGRYRLVGPRSGFVFHKSDLNSLSQVSYRYPYEEYLSYRWMAGQAVARAAIELSRKLKRVRPWVKLASGIIKASQPKKPRAIDRINNLLRAIDDDMNIIAAMFSQDEIARLNQTIAIYNRNERFYRSHSKLTRQSGIYRDFINHPHYANANSFLVIGGGWLFGKQRLSDNWITNREATGRTSFNLEASISISPDIGLSRSSFTRLYAHGFYERFSYDLDPDRQYLFGNRYLVDASQGLYAFSTNEGINLSVRQLGGGLQLATIVGDVVRVDLGAGYILWQQADIHFSDDENYRPLPANDKIPSVASRKGDEKGDLYFQGGLTIPLPGRDGWSRRSGMAFRFSTMYQQTTLSPGMEGLGIFQSSEDGGLLDTGSPLVETEKIMSYKFAFLARF